MREYWIVDPATERTIVYHLEEPDFTMNVYALQDKIKAGIYDDFQIDFKELNL